MSSLSALFSLFVVALLSASILPLQSEALLVYMQHNGNYAVLMLLVVASIGNIIGSVLNWWIGLGVSKLEDRKWFPIRERDIDRGIVWFARFGRWALLFSWVPIIGDPITLVAGFLRMPLLEFLVIVAIAKTARYAILLWIFA